MQRKWYQKLSIISLINILVFIVFIVVFESYTFTKSKLETKNLSQLIQFFVWNLDDASAKQYLDVYIKNQNINKVVIRHPNGKEFLSVEKTETFSLTQSVLKFLFLIRTYPLQEPIFYEKENIGTIEVYWINENIYIYFYAFIILILITIIAHFYVETIIQKNRLNQAFKEINELKIQQDADYYLTSLLIRPLCYINLPSRNYILQHYLEQKKKFTYKKYNTEIGGDFILVKEIQLRKRDYILFINADAMGKSLQGGSGILVLGSILYAILKRLEFRKDDQNKYPETWLKYLCLEIQELFESFQGSMMLSAVIGLIDVNSGIMFYVNFEHPYPIVYRKGKADFIGNNYILRKIGYPKVFQQDIKIQVFELEVQDIFFVGSDGKDDIEMQSEDGTKYINEDETLFLRLVEKYEGELPLIIEAIKQKGKIIDDISILKFHVIHKEVPHINDIPANHTHRLIEEIHTLIRQRKFQQIYILLNPYVEEYGFDNSLLYYYAASCYKLKKYDETIEIGERLLNRIEIIKPIYYILIKSYLAKNELNRSSYLLQEAKKVKLDDDKVNKLELLLNKKQSSTLEKL